MTDRLDRLEAHITKSVAGVLSDLRITGKTRQKDNAMNEKTIPTEVAAVLAEMRRYPGRNTFVHQCADRLESALTKTEAVEPVAWQSRYRYPLPNGGFAEWHEISKDQFEDREALPGHEKRALSAHAPPAVSGRKPLSETMYRGPAHPEGHREQFLDRRCLAADNVPTESLGRDADYPECSGDPASCPENEGHGCCKPNPAKTVASVPDGMVLVSRKDAEAVARFAFNNAGRGLRAPVASAGERILDSINAPPTNQEGAAP